MFINKVPPPEGAAQGPLLPRHWRHLLHHAFCDVVIPEGLTCGS